MQQGDVLLFQIDDDGEIIVEGGITQMSGGLETAVYLSMFGGNEDDDGSSDNPFTWWGNLDELDPVNQYRSETQHLLQALPFSTGNLRRIEDAVNRDLVWMIEAKAATTVDVTVTIPGLNRVKIRIVIDGDTTLEFEANWKASV